MSGDLSNNVVSRRRMLGAAVALAGTAALADFSSAAASAAPVSSAVATGKSGATLKGPSYSPFDGLLLSFVRGPVSAISSSLITLEIPAGVGARTTAGPVPIEISPQSYIHAGGIDTQGDVSNVDIGDIVSVNTIYQDDGTRVASWLISNMRVANVKVTSLAAPDIFGDFRRTSGSGRFSVTPTSSLATTSGEPGNVEVLETISEGDLWSFIGSEDISSPDLRYWIVTGAPAIINGQSS